MAWGKIIKSKNSKKRWKERTSKLFGNISHKEWKRAIRNSKTGQDYIFEAMQCKKLS